MLKSLLGALVSIRRYDQRLHTVNANALPAMVALVFLPASQSPLFGQTPPQRVVAQGVCPGAQPTLPVITEDSVGAIRFNESIASLRRACPSARDTLLTQGGPTSRPGSFPAVVFPLKGLTVIGAQYTRSTLQPDAPADGWIIAGDEGNLIGGIPLSVGWKTLQRHYGGVQASFVGALVVRFCALPRMLFVMDSHGTRVSSNGTSVDLWTIPADATVHHLFIMSPSLARSFHPCH